MFLDKSQGSCFRRVGVQTPIPPLGYTTDRSKYKGKALKVASGSATCCSYHYIHIAIWPTAKEIDIGPTLCSTVPGVDFEEFEEKIDLLWDSN